jgi:hypothetical protein
MHVVAHLKAFYDQAPLPADVVPTNADIAAGKVRMKRDGSGWTMRVRKERVTHNFSSLSELEICKHIIALAMPKRGRQKVSRRHAVADYLASQSYVDQFEHSDVTSFECHDEAGPDEALFRATAAPYLTAIYDATGQPLLSAADLEALVALYIEPATKDDHVDHLHARFGVAKKAVNS